MTALYHAYTQTVADGTATSVVRPSDWNSAHVQSQTISGNTAGVSSFSGTNIVLQGGNNVTLSAATAAGAATIIVSGANTVAQTVQTQASGAIAGTGFTSTTTAGTAVVATQGTNGLSMAVPAFVTTFDATSGRAGTGFTSTTTAGTNITAALGTDGLSMAVPAFLTTSSQSVQTQASGAIAGTGFTSTTTAGTAITAALGTNGLSMAVPAYVTTFDATSGRAGTGFTSTTTAGTAITAALGTNGLSMAVPAFVTTYDATSGRAGTGTTLALTNLTGTVSVNTNGVALSLSASPAGGGGVALQGSGTYSQNTGTVQFVNSNGVTFGLSTNQMTASVKTDYAGTGFTSTTTAGTAITAALGTNGLSMAVPAFVTTFDATSGRAGTGFTSTTTAGTAITAALGTNGLSMAVPQYITTYVNDLTSGRAGTGFTSTTTAGTAITAALGTNGLSMAVPAFVTTYDATSGRAGTGTTLALTNLSGTLNVGTNGVALSLNNPDDHFYGWNLVGNTAGTTSLSLTTEAPIYFSGGNNITLSGNSNTIVIQGAAGGAGGDIGIADGNGVTITSGTVVFSNSNGVSFGLAGSTMTGSVNLGAGIAIADGGGTASTGTVVFSNSNNITFGLNNNTITASYEDPYETILLYPPSGATTVGQNINNSLTVMFLPLDHNLKANRLDLLGSISVATNNNTSSAAMLWTVSAVMYTRNGNTLSSVSSTTQVGEVRWQSNSTASVTGARLFSAPLVVSTDQGYYWLGLQLSTRATGHTGAATTSLGNTVSMIGVGSAQFGAFTVGDFGAATNSSNSWFPTGMYSGTTNLTAIALSNISYVGTLGNRAQVAVRMLST